VCSLFWLHPTAGDASWLHRNAGLIGPKRYAIGAATAAPIWNALPMSKHCGAEYRHHVLGHVMGKHGVKALRRESSPQVASAPHPRCIAPLPFLRLLPSGSLASSGV
jgi:hypothetical protein